MTKVLHVAPERDLPAKILTESIAVIGRKRSGKSNDAAVIVEEALDLPLQTIIFDPKGDWWGITSSADGKHEGYPVVILGGKHSTIEGVGLAPGAGTATAKWVIETGYSVLLDLSQLELPEIERFCFDFLTELRRAKIAKPGSILLVVDEADELAPEDQRERIHVIKTMGRLIWCVKRGGAFGIGTLFITQRVASLSKNILSQTEILVVLQTTGTQDLDAVSDAVKHHVPGATKKERTTALEDLLREIVKLNKGEAVVVSGQMLKGIFHIPFRRRRTFDSGATPDLGQAPAQPKVVAKVALDRLSDAMQRAVEEVKANDPAALKAEVVRLRREMHEIAQQRLAPAPVIEAKPKTEYVLKEGQLARAERIVERGHELVEKFRATGAETAKAIEAKTIEYVGDFGAMLGPLAAAISFTKSVPSAVSPSTSDIRRPERGHVAGGTAVRAGESRSARLGEPVRDRASHSGGEIPSTTTRSVNPPARTTDDAGALSGTHRRILAALAWRELTFGVKSTPKATVAAMIGVAFNGGFRSRLAEVRGKGLVDYPDTMTVALTGAGAEVADPGTLPSTLDELHQQLQKRLSGTQWRILKTLIEVYPESLTKSEVAERIGVEFNGGFRSRLSEVKTLGLVVYPSTMTVAASPVAMLEAA